MVVSTARAYSPKPAAMPMPAVTHSPAPGSEAKKPLALKNYRTGAQEPDADNDLGKLYGLIHTSYPAVFIK